jgi:hypothetical protein
MNVTTPTRTLHTSIDRAPDGRDPMFGLLNQQLADTFDSN